MKRAILLTALFAGLLGVSWGAFRAAVAPPAGQLARLMPAGALLYLQAKDFSSLLGDWNRSQEKNDWLKSKNYDVFEKSRLLLRLKDAGNEFSNAAGVPSDANLLAQVAGKESVLALYDIGKLQFLYITRMGANDAAQSALWQTRSKFETRNAGGVNFFYRRDPESEREVAFASSGDYLLLATREDLVAGALELLAGTKDKAQSLEAEGWWSRAAGAAGAPGDLRMVLNLEKIVPTPYFRSYWIQRNVTDTKQYSAAISDLTRAGGEYREERILFRKDPAAREAGKGEAAVSEILRAVPADTGVYEAKAEPDAKASAELLTVKLLAPHLGPAIEQKIAPEVRLGGGETAAASDLETRIDQAPAQVQPSAGSNRGAAVENLFAKNHVLAQLQVQGTERDAAGAFVRIHSGVAFLGEADWDERAVKDAVAEFVRPAFTTARLGVEWKTESGQSVLDGLWPLAIAARGKYLLIADNAVMLGKMLEGLNNKTKSDAGVVFAAGFDHQAERENFAALTKALNARGASGVNGAPPDFFSENITSLSFALRAVSSEKVVVRDLGERQNQSVIYTWAR